MGDRLAHHECADQVLDGSSLAAVGPEVEGVQTSVEGGWFKISFWFKKKFLPLGTQLVEDGDVCVGVVDVVGVRGVLMPRPFVRSGHICTCKMRKVERNRLPMSNMEFSGFDSSSTLSNPDTCCRKRWRSG